MAITFKYPLINRPPPYNPIRLPTIPVTFYGHNGKSLDIVGLLDSGADVTTIPKEIGELLDLDMSSNKTEIRGIGGKLSAAMDTIRLRIKNAHESYTVSIPVMIPLVDLETVPEILLGRKGIFDRFDICFKEKDQKIIFRKRV